MLTALARSEGLSREVVGWKELVEARFGMKGQAKELGLYLVGDEKCQTFWSGKCGIMELVF
jgi:deoxyribodipyrimidine photolyase-like uncharacterized protein